MERNSAPDMNLRVIGKIYQHDGDASAFDTCFDDIEINLRTNQSNDLFPAVTCKLSSVIFSAYSFCL